jgi:oxygen-independent coproporphyrinogen-3 oxidase
MKGGGSRTRITTLHIAEKYDLRVPRYTSYPTAPHFSAAVGEEQYRGWLAALDPAEPISLYTHIPFCDSMCWFCGCYTKIVGRYEPIHAYLVTLHEEIRLLAAALPARLEARHMHWGGGSPTMLRPDDWLALIDLLRAHFDVTADAEIAVELDPRDTTEAYVAALARVGVNRVSIGVQDFDPEVQAAINRDQPFAVVERVCGWLRAHGIQRINLDLMYGLPHQTVERVLSMVDLAVSLDPSRIALFGYAHVPWMKSHQKLIDEATLPGAAERWRQLTEATRRLGELGFHAVGLDHFARPDDGLSTALTSGRLRRNFQGYTTDEATTLLGLGASAIGSLPQGYVQNAAPLHEYSRAIESGRLPTARGIALNADDRLRRRVIEELMCGLAVDLDAVCADVGGDAEALAAGLGRLTPLVEDGLTHIDGHRILVTDAGRPFVRIVAAAFDAYLDVGEKRHSRAV